MDSEYFILDVSYDLKVFVDFVNGDKCKDVLSRHYLFLKLVVKAHPTPQQHCAVYHT